MLFYFTATGNSLYVAKQLSENPISIPQVLRGGNLNFEAETIGIVCPIYAGDPPAIVVEFLRKASFKTDYFYIVMTYGNDHTDAAECTARVAKGLGINVDYVNTISMVDNYLPVYDMNEQIARETKVDEQIELIRHEIAARMSKVLEATDAQRALHANVASMFSANPSFNNGEGIIMKDNCNGCATCTKLCPVGNFYMEDGIAKRRNGACGLFCLACVHHCPQKAIGLRMERNPNARYRNEHVTLKDIIEANNQL